MVVQMWIENPNKYQLFQDEIWINEAMKYGKQCQDEGQWERSIRIFQKLKIIFENHPEREKDYYTQYGPSIPFQLGCVFQEMGRWEEALEQYDCALKLNEKEAKFYANKARVLESKSNISGALECLEKAIKTTKEPLVAQLQLGTLFFRIQSFEEALRLFEQVLKKNACNYLAQLHRGLSLMHLRNFQEAQRTFESLIQLRPYEVKVRLHLADCLRRQLKIEQAFKVYDDAIELNKSDGLALIAKATTLVQLLRANEALTLIELALKFNPFDVHANFTKATALEACQLIKEALVYCRLVLSLNPQHLAARNMQQRLLLIN